MNDKKILDMGILIGYWVLSFLYLALLFMENILELKFMYLFNIFMYGLFGGISLFFIIFILRSKFVKGGIEE